MDELRLVDLLVDRGVRLPGRAKECVQVSREVRAVSNRADIVYFAIHEDTVGPIAAIEAKIHDWRKALRQAYRNRLFAHWTYVAVPENHAAGALDNIAEFHRASVGLILVGSQHTKVYYHPPVNEVHSPNHLKRVHRHLLQANT